MKTFLYTMLWLAVQTTMVSVGANADVGPNESQIKAAYLYKFAAYVEWPPAVFVQADAPLTVGIIGADEIAEELRLLIKDRSVNGRVIHVKSLKIDDSVDEIQILFIGQRESGHLKNLLKSVQTRPILTVTEATNALDAGSIINFLSVDERIRFEVSVMQAERNGLKVSARLLAVAQKIDARSP